MLNISDRAWLYRRTLLDVAFDGTIRVCSTCAALVSGQPLCFQSLHCRGSVSSSVGRLRIEASRFDCGERFAYFYHLIGQRLAQVVRNLAKVVSTD
jgi:hypothetical protein